MEHIPSANYEPEQDRAEMFKEHIRLGLSMFGTPEEKRIFTETFLRDGGFVGEINIAELFEQVKAEREEK